VALLSAIIKKKLQAVQGYASPESGGERGGGGWRAGSLREELTGKKGGVQSGCL